MGAHAGRAVCTGVGHAACGYDSSTAGSGLTSCRQQKPWAACSYHTALIALPYLVSCSGGVGSVVPLEPDSRQHAGIGRHCNGRHPHGLPEAPPHVQVIGNAERLQLLEGGPAVECTWHSVTLIHVGTRSCCGE